MAAEPPPWRLKKPERILTTAKIASPQQREAGAADAHLNSVPLDRIRQLTIELREGTLPDLDDIAIRLLNEYTTAVSHLRAVATLAAATVDRSARPMKEARRAIHRHAKQLRAELAAPPLTRRPDAAPPEPSE